MNRVLLAWEMGAARGHITNLARIARALHGVAECDAILAHMDYAHELKEWCTVVAPGVRLTQQNEARLLRSAPPYSTWAQYLYDAGLHDEAILRYNVSWWLDVFHRRHISLVISEHAPCVIMAARIAGIPVIALGSGYSAPPSNICEFPVFIPEYSIREASETQLTGIVNSTLGPMGFPEIAKLPEIYERAGDMITTFAFLDPYADQRSKGSYLPLVLDFEMDQPTKGGDLFCYFSTSNQASEQLVEALGLAGLPVRAVLPEASSDTLTKIEAAGVKVSKAPISQEEIVRTSKMFVNSGQNGILSLGAAAGIPQVCLPLHLEQYYHAKQADTVGTAIAIWPPSRQATTDMVAIIQTAFADQEFAQRAHSLGSTITTITTEKDKELIQLRVQNYLDL